MLRTNSVSAFGVILLFVVAVTSTFSVGCSRDDPTAADQTLGDPDPEIQPSDIDRYWWASIPNGFMDAHDIQVGDAFLLGHANNDFPLSDVCFREIFPWVYFDTRLFRTNPGCGGTVDWENDPSIQVWSDDAPLAGGPYSGAVFSIVGVGYRGPFYTCVKIVKCKFLTPSLDP